MPAPRSRIDLDELRAMAEQGYARRDVCERFGVTRERVRQVLNKHGIKMRAMNVRPPERVERVLTCIRRGMTVQETMAETGLTHSQTRIIGAKHGHRWSSRRFPLDLIKRARELASQGRHTSEISKELGVNYSTIISWERCYGFDITRKSAGYGPAGAVPRDQFRALLAEGLSGVEIARRCGVSGSAVYQRAARMGLPVRQTIIVPTSEFRSLAEQGLTATEISTRLKVPRDVVYGRLRKYDIPYRKHPSGRPRNV